MAIGKWITPQPVISRTAETVKLMNPGGSAGKPIPTTGQIWPRSF